MLPPKVWAILLRSKMGVFLLSKNQKKKKLNLSPLSTSEGVHLMIEKKI
jgi:hypothetical protein